MICFLDMDGVLSNFNKGCFLALGLKYDYNHPALREWDWHEYFDLSFDEVDSACTEDFWAGLQWMHDGREILKIVEDYFGQDQIFLLTCPMPNPGSATGKVLWVERHLPRYKKRLIITQAPKRYFVGQDRVLIDDRLQNCSEFVLAGGQAILVPRPWNGDGLTVPGIIAGLAKLRKK